jgi:dienelactone hydrolase
MKKIFSISVLAIIIFVACSSETNKETEVKTETNQIVEQSSDSITDVTNESSVNYELILSKDTSNKNLIVFIDPHGDGNFISDKIKAISDKLNSNIICLNNVENNIPNYADLINQDIKEFSEKTSINPDKIYIVGFSGGARMAYQYAIKNNVSGIVMCGAGLGNMIENYTNFPIALIAGDGDFNFNEQYYSPFSEIAKDKRVISLSFKGKHEWPNNDLLLFAINYVKNDTKSFNYSELMNEFVELQKHNEQYAAFKKIEAINKIFSTDETKADFDNFISSESFKAYIGNFEKSLQQEFDRNNRLANSVLTENWEWWNKQINEIDETIKSSNNQLEKASYQRTRAYLGIVMYSVTSREINNQGSKKIEKYLKIYEKLEPDNPDLKKFKDIYQYQSNS